MSYGHRYRPPNNQASSRVQSREEGACNRRESAGLACVDILTRNGYRVSACSSFKEGARQLEAGFDLIILSQGTADFESQSLLERLIEIDRRVPVVVVTRSVNMGCYLDAMQLGARDYVEKPLSSEQLLRIVGSSLPPPIAG